MSEQLGLIFAKFIVGQKTGDIDTFIRLNVTEAAPLGGTIGWHVRWQPVAEDGFLVAV